MVIENLKSTSPDITNGARIDDRFAGQERAENRRLMASGVGSESVELAIVYHDLGAAASSTLI